MWGSCAKCGTTGDALSLYCVNKELTSTWEAVEKINESGLLLTSIGTAKSCYPEYELARKLRERVEEFWMECRTEFKQYPGPHPVALSYGLEIDRNISLQFVGSTKAKRLQEVLGVEVKTNKDILILPFYDVPGRIASFRAYYVSGRKLQSRDIPLSYASEHGLYLLNGIRLDTEAVLAVDDPMLAFKIQNRCILTNLVPWPVVAYTTKSTRWDVVTAEKIVFFAEDFSTDLFAIACNTPNAYICKPPKEFDIHRKLLYCSPRSWMAEILQYSVHWKTALATWLCHGIQRDEAAAALEKLSLTPAVRKELVDSLNDVESKKMLSEFMSSSAYAKRLTFEGSKISERRGKWYTTVPSTNSEYLVSDCLIRFTGTVRAGDENYYTGEVVRNNVRKKLFVRTDLPRGSQKSWLEDFCLKNGLGCPEISPAWERRLFAVARAFSGELPNEVLDPKVGWSRDLTTFRLPNRVVHDGNILDEVGTPIDGYPCHKVTGRGVTPALIRQLLSDEPGNAEFWATFACMMANVYTPYTKTPPKCIGVVGDINFGATFVKAMDLVPYNGIIHDVPAYLEVSKISAHALRAVSEENSNVVVDLSPLAASFVISDAWVFVQANQGVRAWDHGPFVYDLIAHAVRFLQGGSMSLTSYAPDTFLAEFPKFLTHRFFNGKSPNYDVLQKAAELISVGVPFGGKSPGDAFLYGVFLLIQDGDTAISVKKNSIMVDSKTVCLPKKVVMSILAGDTESVREDLRRRGVLVKSSSTGWYVDRKYWDKLFMKFDREYSF